MLVSHLVPSISVIVSDKGMDARVSNLDKRDKSAITRLSRRICQGPEINVEYWYV